MSQFIPTVLESTTSSFLLLHEALASLVVRIHIDFADNTLVPNKTLLPSELPELHVGIEYDAHLMVDRPSQYFSELQKKGFKRVIVHAECKEDVNNLLELAKQHELELILAVNSHMSIDAIASSCQQLGGLLVMAIEPGFGSQPFLESTYDRLREVKMKLPGIQVFVDGGVRFHNANELLASGADILMVGKGGYAQDVPANIAKWQELIKTYDLQKGLHAR